MKGSTVIDQALVLLPSHAQRNFPVSTLTTYKVGGHAALFVRAQSSEDLLAVGRASRESGLQVVIIGRGSNLLFCDEEFFGIVVQLGDFANVIDIPRNGTSRIVKVGAGVALPVVARRTVAAGLGGFEWAVGVPGSVGGAVRMNAGGHGSDMAASLREVTVFDLGSMSTYIVSLSDLDLQFRGSNLTEHQVVIDAHLLLHENDTVHAAQTIDSIVAWRREHQPGGQNAGSVFVNPVPGQVSAGQLIDELGLRGFRIGSAAISLKHANFIQADEGGCARDVVAVMSHVRHIVRDTYGYHLRSEIKLIGFPEDMDPVDADLVR